MRAMRFGIAALVLAAAVGQADAATIATRANLNSLLGGAAVTEGFEAYTIGANSVANLGSTFDATSTPNGQGPGLVVPGIRFSRSSNQLQILGTTAFGGNSQRLAWDVSPGPIEFEFLSPTTAFGVDLLTLFGSAGPTTVSVFGSDKTTLIQSFPGLVLNTNPQTPVFFGFEDAGGIGRVTFSVASGGPDFDNVTFGTPRNAPAVPEPTSLALAGFAGIGMAVGAWRRRRQQKSAVA